MRISARAPRIHALLLPLALTLVSCRNDSVEQTPRLAPRGATEAPAAAPATPGDSGVTGAPVAGVPQSAPRWTEREVVGQVEGFLSTIKRGDRDAFMSKLSRRSKGVLSDLHATDEVWGVAVDAFDDIGHRKISVIGGSADSVATLISGERTVEGEETSDPVIMSLLREDGDWKVMYPGLLYPSNHLKR